ASLAGGGTPRGEEWGRPTQIPRSPAPRPFTAQPLAVEQLGTGHQKWRDELVRRQSRLELRARVPIPHQRAATCEHGPPRRRGRILHPIRITVEWVRRLLETPGTRRRLDQVRDRPKPDQWIEFGALRSREGQKSLG